MPIDDGLGKIAFSTGWLGIFMFSKPVPHPLFKELNRGLFGYKGKLDALGYQDIDIDIRGRSKSLLNFAVGSIEGLKEHFVSFTEKATKEAYDNYEAMKEAVKSGEYDLEEDGGELPGINKPEDVWLHMVLESIVIEPKKKYKMRLGFRCPWDIEHDFGIYLINNEFQYCGISV